MKRSIVATATTILMLGGLTSGCSGPVAEPARSAPETGGWVLPPAVDTVQRRERGLMVMGTTAPLGRVVLRAGGAVAYAASADEQGRFEVRIDSPATDTLFMVEAQRGQVGVPAPYRMLVTADPSGPIALLSPGAASRRLDAGPVLDALDSDGGVILASGRATAMSVVAVRAGGETMDVRVDGSGHWFAPLNLGGTSGLAVQVGSTTFAYPGASDASTSPAEVDVERAGSGWRVRWSAADTSQVTWFPDRQP